MTQLSQDELALLLRQYGRPIVALRQTQQMPYEIRSLAVAGTEVVAGDKSGTLARIRINPDESDSFHSISAGSIDALAVTPIAREWGVRETYHLFVGTRLGELFSVRLQDGVALASFKPIGGIPPLSSAVTSLEYEADSETLIVAEESGHLLFLRIAPGEGTARLVSQGDVAPFPVSICVLPASYRGRNPTQLLVACKLGAIYRCAFLQDKHAQQSPTTTLWHNMQSTINCMTRVFGYGSGAPLDDAAIRGVFVGTNHGASWVGWRGRDPTGEAIQLDMPSEKRVMSLQIVRVQQAGGRTEFGGTHWLVIGHQDGRIALLPVPQDRDYALFLSALSRADTISVYTDTSPCFMLASALQGQGPAVRSDYATLLASGTRSHRVELYGIPHLGESLMQLRTGLAALAESWHSRLQRLLDSHPGKADVRDGMALVLCDMLTGQVADFPTDTRNREAALDLLLRILRNPSPELPRRILRKISAAFRAETLSAGLISAAEAADLAEYVEKYIIGGPTFNDKTICLRSLASFNERQSRDGAAHRNALDAVIYRSLLVRRQGLDLVQELEVRGLVWSLAWDQATRVLAASTNDGTIAVYRLERGSGMQSVRLQPVGQVAPPVLSPSDVHGNYARALAFTKNSLIIGLWDGRLLRARVDASGGAEGPLSMARKPLLPSSSASVGPVYSVAQWPHDPERILVGTRAGQVWEIDLESGRLGASWRGIARADQTDECAYPKHGVSAGQGYRPMWDLACSPDGRAENLVCGASHDGHLYLLEREGSSLTVRDSVRFEAFPNCVRYAPGVGDSLGTVAAGGEDGAVFGLEVITSESGILLQPKWAFHTCAGPVRDAVRLPGEVGGGWLFGTLSGDAFWLSDAGEQVACLKMGIPCNALAFLGMSPESTPDHPIALLASGGEAGGEALRLFELSPVRVCDDLFETSLREYTEQSDTRALGLRRASAVRIDANPMRLRILRHRYCIEAVPGSSADPARRDSDIEALAHRARMLIASGFSSDSHALLVELVRIAFELLSTYPESDHDLALSVLRLYEDVSNQWSVFGASENDAVRLAAFDALFSHLTLAGFQRLFGDEMGALAVQRQLHSLSHSLLTLVSHPNAAVRQEILALLRRFGDRCIACPVEAADDSSPMETGWLLDALIERLPTGFSNEGALSWSAIQTARTIAKLVSAFRLSPFYLGYLLTKRGQTALTVRYVAALAADEGVSSALEPLAELLSAMEAGNVEVLRPAVTKYSTAVAEALAATPSRPSEGFSFLKPYSDVLVFLEALLSARSLGEWKAPGSTGNEIMDSVYFPLTAEALSSVAPICKEIAQYVRLPYGDRLEPNLVCTRTLRTLVDQLEANDSLGVVRRCLQQILREWLTWLDIERQIRLPLHCLETFQRTAGQARRQQPLESPYQHSVRDLFRMLHHSLDSEHSRLYDFRPTQEYYYQVSGDSTETIATHHRNQVRALRLHLNRSGSKTSTEESVSSLLGWDASRMTTISCTRAGRIHYVMVFMHRSMTHDILSRRETLGRLPALLEAYYLLAHRLRQEADILSIAAHQLQDPLHSLRMGLEVLFSRHVQGHPEAEDRRQELLGRTDLFISIINSIVDSQRLESEEIPLARECVDMRALIHDPLRIARQNGRSKRLNILYSEPEDPVSVCVDPAKIKDALNMILGNAVKYSPQRGTITVALERSSDECFTSIEDEGIGIPAEELPHVFELYFRGREPRRRRYVGSGIGLHMAQRYVLAHDGDIWPHSDGAGKGARFTVRLPLVQEGGTT